MKNASAAVMTGITRPPALRRTISAPLRTAPDAYCLRYGLPSAAGGTVRPITPATAIRVRT